jgi:hypothetical protein
MLHNRMGREYLAREAQQQQARQRECAGAGRERNEAAAGMHGTNIAWAARDWQMRHQGWRGARSRLDLPP